MCDEIQLTDSFNILLFSYTAGDRVKCTRL